MHNKEIELITHNEVWNSILEEKQKVFKLHAITMINKAINEARTNGVEPFKVVCELHSLQADEFEILTKLLRDAGWQKIRFTPVEVSTAPTDQPIGIPTIKRTHLLIYLNENI